MIAVFCKNKDCKKYGGRSPLANPKYAFRNGKLVPVNIPRCPECGKEMDYEEELNKEMPNISIGEFRMMSPSDKGKMLKKRAQNFAKKEDAEGQKRFYQEKAIKNMLNIK